METYGKKNQILVESVEFRFNNGVHIVYHKHGTQWAVTKYVHGKLGEITYTRGMLPSIENAQFFNKML